MAETWGITVSELARTGLATLVDTQAPARTAGLRGAAASEPVKVALFADSTLLLVRVTRDDSGGWIAHLPELDGALTYANALRDSRHRVLELIELASDHAPGHCATAVGTGCELVRVICAQHHLPIVSGRRVRAGRIDAVHR